MPTGVKGFKKGNPGKPQGALNKSTKLIKEVFTEVFNNMQNDPKASLEKWAKDNPGDYYKLAIRLIPTQMQISGEISITDEPVTFE